MQPEDPMSVQDDESPDQILNQLLELMSALQSNPFDHGLHQRNVALCQKLGVDTIHELNQARSLMSEYFPVKEDFFQDWISDLVSCYQSPYEASCVEMVLNVYEQASSYAFFPKIEAARLEYTIDLYYRACRIQKPTGDLMELIEESLEKNTMDVDDPAGQPGDINEEQQALEQMITQEKLRACAIDVMDRIGYHLVESSAAWNMWALYEFDTLKRDWNQEGLSRFKMMLQARLRIPHTDSSRTFQMYSTLITKYDNDHYEDEMVAVNDLYSPARKLMEDREVHEVQLKNSGYSAQEYLKYLSWELSRKPPHVDLILMLFERALLDHPNSAELWLECLRYLHQLRDQVTLSIAFARRATRTIPWSGDVWASAIRTFERNNQTAEAIEELCARGLNSKFLEHDVEAWVTFTIGRADFHRRRLDAYIAAGGGESKEQVQSLIQTVGNVLQEGIDKTKKVFPKSGDPSCRLEKYLTALYEHHDQQEDAAQIWHKATKQYRNLCSTWISAAESEVRHGNFTRAREYYKKASNIKLDYPEYLLEAWLMFEHHFGTLDDLEYTISKVNNIMKGINARRRREAEQNCPESAAQANPETQVCQPSASQSKREEENHETRKRKSEEAIEDDLNGDKKPRLTAKPHESDKLATKDDHTELKRDRENSTVLLAGLTLQTTEANINQLFRDCGKIREITIHKTHSDDVVATVEFEDRASVLPAQTKDKKLLHGVEVAVSLAWRSTLYVTNFPEDANDEWIRSKFSPFGSILDVRWPSKRFKSTRRFCYIQFTSPGAAEAALALHNLEVSPKQKMSVLISDPARKQTRSDSHANEREIYITCLGKFVQESDLRKLFAQFGDIKGVRLITDKAGHSKGFAFVEFENEMSARAALTMNNFELKKKRIGVTISSSKGLSLARKTTAFKDEERLSTATDHRSRSVKVSNLPPGVQEALVQQAFESFGKVIKTITYPERNEALIEFALEKDAGLVFLHKEPIIIGGQTVEVSVPSTSVNVGLASSSSFTPLVPRSTANKKTRLGLGLRARPSIKPQGAEANQKSSADKANVGSDSEMIDQNQSNSSMIASKTQDDFRRMLG